MEKLSNRWVQGRFIFLEESYPHAEMMEIPSNNSFIKHKKYGTKITLSVSVYELPDNSKYYDEWCGVYFLVKDEDIVYVGQTVNLRARISQHQRKREYDKVMFFPIDKDILNEAELYFIRTIKPKHNKKSN